jgi:long-chain acyl-CoA synthetase
MSNPTIYATLIDYSRSVGESPAYLRIAESGGSMMPLSLAEQVADRLRAAVVTVWGSAETMGIAIASNAKVPQTTDLLLGSMCPYYGAQVVDTDGGEAGELRIRGPAVAAGYSTPLLGEENPFRDGWYYTGDLVKFGPDLQLHLVGRRYDMIKCRGFKVYPAEVEAVLVQHPSVRDAAIVGVLDARIGETVAAAVVTMPGQTILVRELLQFCKNKLEPHKVPRAVHFVSEIPRDHNGKVLRSRLSTLVSASALD